jgi:uncharacterized FlgJ-related protein
VDNHTKAIFRKIKKWTIYISGVIFFSFMVYAAGTFYPNNWVVQKIEKVAEQKIISEWKSFGYQAPTIIYSNNTEFVIAVGKCINYHNLSLDHNVRVHRDIIIAMAVLETGYGTSRFAIEGNNLFGIRTWTDSVPQLKPLGNLKAKFGVKKYKTKCDSVLDMIKTINRHPAYEGFRTLRTLQIESGVIDIGAQIDQLHKWSTNPDYTKLVKNKAKAVEKILIKFYDE